MINRVFRGERAGGLVRYLYGPGRHNEHVGQRLVAGWAGSDEFALRGLDPARHVDVTAAGGLESREFRGRLDALVRELEAPLVYSDRALRRPVFHLAMSAAPGDRTLTDAEWGDLAADAMHRTGIAPRGDDGGCRWIAMRHADNHIHVAAVLARQDGAPLRLSNEYRKLAAAREAAETRYGLARTAPADATAAKHTSRQETEKAGRAGLVPARGWLREQVQHAAAASTGPVEFFDRLRAAGVVIHVRRAPDYTTTGYAVGRREPGPGQPILYSGSRLAADLSLPKLTKRWQTLTDHTNQPGPAAGVRPTIQPAGAAAGPSTDDPRVLDDAADRTHVWDQAIAAAAAAADEVRALADTNPEQAGDAAAAAADVLAAASRLIEGDTGGPLTRAARDYDRAARERFGRTPQLTPAGASLRMAALQLARAARGAPRRSEAARITLLIAQMARLTESVQQLREAQRRQAQHDAAAQAGATLAADAATWLATAQTIHTEDAAQAGGVRLTQPSQTRTTMPQPRGRGR